MPPMQALVFEVQEDSDVSVAKLLLYSLARRRFPAATLELALAVAVMVVEASVIDLSEVVMGTSVVVGRGVTLLKKLGVTGTATPTTETVIATISPVVSVDTVVGVAGSDEKVNGASAVVDVALGVVVGDSTKGNTSDPVVVGLESVDASVLEVAEATVVREKFPVPPTMDPMVTYPLAFEEMVCLAV